MKQMATNSNKVACEINVQVIFIDSLKVEKVEKGKVCLDLKLREGFSLWEGEFGFQLQFWFFCCFNLFVLLAGWDYRHFFLEFESDCNRICLVAVIRVVVYLK